MHEQKTEQSRVTNRNITRTETNKLPMLSCYVIYYPFKYPKEGFDDENLRLLAALWNCCCFCCPQIPMATKIDINIPKYSIKHEIEQLIAAKIVKEFSTESNPIIANKVKIQNITCEDLDNNFILLSSQVGFLAWKE